VKIARYLAAYSQCRLFSLQSLGDVIERYL
ncbi:MAG: hypothetical protein ACI9K9_001967, partial [Neolewinella sp.]